MEYADHHAVTDRDLPQDGAEARSLFKHSMDRQSHDASGQSCPLKTLCEEGWGLGGHPLAMVYAPCQGFRDLYDPETALERGTLFSELDLPLEAAGGNRRTLCGGCGRSNKHDE